MTEDLERARRIASRYNMSLVPNDGKEEIRRLVVDALVEGLRCRLLWRRPDPQASWRVTSEWVVSTDVDETFAVAEHGASEAALRAALERARAGANSGSVVPPVSRPEHAERDHPEDPTAALVTMSNAEICRFLDTMNTIAASDIVDCDGE